MTKKKLCIKQDNIEINRVITSNSNKTTYVGNHAHFQIEYIYMFQCVCEDYYSMAHVES